MTHQANGQTIVRWPRELSAQQLQKTHANRKSTSKTSSRKHLHQFDSTCAANAQNFILQRVFFIWLHCEHLQHLQCEHLQRVFSNWWSCFLNLQVFFFYLQHVSLFGCVVSICSTFLCLCCEYLLHVFCFCSTFIYLVVFWAFAARVLSNWWSCFLNLQVFFSIWSVFLYLFVLWVFAAHFLFLQHIYLFGCVVSICSTFLCLCCEYLQHIFCFCSTFIYLVVLWAFAAHVLSNWWSCFFNLQVFFSVCSTLSSLGHRTIALAAV